MDEPYEFDVQTWTLIPPLRWSAETLRSDGKHEANPRRLQVEAAVALNRSL